MKFSNYNDVERYLLESDCEVISFDVFDTLLQRDCTPEFVLRSLSFRVRDLLVDEGCVVTVDPLQARHDSHSVACSQLLSEDDDQDLTLLEWIPFWIEHLTGSAESATATLVQRVYDLELECELAFLRPNLQMLKICQKLSELGRRMLFCSDMYLGKAAIEFFLQELGFGGIFETGVCSGDLRRLKRSGRLFECVSKQLGLGYRSILHVGDNEKADYLVPRSLGISSVLLMTEDQTIHHERLSCDESKESSLPKFTGVNAYQYCLSRSGSFESVEEELGFEIFGGPLTLFAHRIVEYCIENSIQRVYFLAREGFLLKGLFKRVLQDYGDAASGIVPHYLAVSRHTSFLASANSFGLREVSSSVANGPRVTLSSLFAPFDIPSEKLVEIGKRYGFQFPDVDLPPFFMDWPPLHKIINDTEIVSHIQEKLELSKDLLNDYLTQEGFLAGGKVALVDVGWSGQIQDNIYQATLSHAHRPEIHGLYLGTRVRAQQRANLENRFVSLICDEMLNDWHQSEALRFVFPWEILPRAPHGTVVSYRREDEQVLPVFKSESQPSRQAEMIDEACIHRFQKGIYRFASIYQNYWKVVRPFSMHLLDAFLLPFYGLSRYPTVQALDTISGLRNVSDLGLNDVFLLVQDRANQSWKHSLWPGGQLMARGVTGSKRRRLYKKEAVRQLRTKRFRDENWVNYPIDFGGDKYCESTNQCEALTVTDKIFESLLKANDYRTDVYSNQFLPLKRYESLVSWLPEDYALVKYANFCAYLKKKQRYEISGSLLRELKRRVQAR